MKGGDEESIIASNHIIIPRGVIDDNFNIIFAKDIIDNYLNINPEYLNKQALYESKTSKSLISYMKSLNNEYYNDLNNNNRHNASAAVLLNLTSMNFNKSIGANNIFDYLLPQNLDDTDFDKFIQLRIDELMSVESLLSDILIQNIKWLGLDLATVKYLEKTSFKSEHIKILKNAIDNNIDKITLNNKNSIVYDLSQFGGGKVYISNSVLDDSEKLIQLDLLPSRYLIRSRRYDYIIVTHNIGRDVINNEVVWKIDSIDVDGVEYTDIRSLITKLNVKNSKKFLLLVCNPNSIDLSEFSETRQVQIDYADNKKHIGYNIGINGLYVINESRPISPTIVCGNILNKWSELIKKYIIKMKLVEKSIFKILDSYGTYLYPNNTHYLYFNNSNNSYRLDLIDDQCKSLNNFIDIKYSSIMNVIDVYYKVMYTSKIMLKFYRDFINNTMLESGYFWSYYDNFGILLNRDLYYANDTRYRYKNVEECLEDASLLNDILNEPFFYGKIYSDNEKISVVRTFNKKNI